MILSFFYHFGFVVFSSSWELWSTNINTIQYLQSAMFQVILIPPGSKNSKKFCLLFCLRTFWDYSHREEERIVLEVYCTGDVLHWRYIALGISERTLGADWSDDKVAKSMLRPSRRETGPKPFPLHRLLRALSSCRKRLIFKKKGMMD